MAAVTSVTLSVFLSSTPYPFTVCRKRSRLLRFVPTHFVSTQKLIKLIDIGRLVLLSHSGDSCASDYLRKPLL